MHIDNRRSTYLSSLNFDKTKCELPSIWNPGDKCSYIELTECNTRAKFSGVGRNVDDAAAIRADKYIPNQVGIFYFEVKILEKGLQGCFGIGLSKRDVPLTRLPGWESDSYGYHGDDGNFFKSIGVGKKYGPTYTENDVIGCCFNTISGSLFFTKNGENIGIAHTFKVTRDLQLYPTVGMKSTGETIEVNFGKDPFVFEISSYINEQKLKIYTDILNYNSPVVPTKSGMEVLILSYLIHSGYAESASSFFKDIKTINIPTESCTSNMRTTSSRTEDFNLEEEILSIRFRKLISEMVDGGKIEEAIKITLDKYPDIFVRHRTVYFKLKCGIFLELIKEIHDRKKSICPDEEKIKELENKLFLYGKYLQSEFTKDANESFDLHMMNIFSLLSEKDPYLSPESWFLDDANRTALSESLVSAILIHEGHQPLSSFDRILKQTILLFKELSVEGSGIPAMIDWHKDFIM